MKVFLETVFILCVSTTVNLMTSHYERDTAKDNKTYDLSRVSLGSSFYINNHAFCAGECSKHEHCAAVLFNVNSLMCLFLKEYLKSDFMNGNYTNENGWIYFYRIDECLPGWVRYDRHCYFWHHNGKNWMDAVSTCVSENSKLVEIDSKGENAFLVQRHSGIYWTVWNDIESENNFVNNNNQPMTWNKWGPSQPNTGTEEDCVVFTDNDGWHDYMCSEIFYFVCEMGFT